VNRIVSTEMCIYHPYLIHLLQNFSEWDGSVGVVTRGSKIRDSITGTTSRPAVEPTQPPQSPFPAVNLQERQANHLPPRSTEIMNAWSCTSTPGMSRLHDLALN
jgi:hypothetical protein